MPRKLWPKRPHPLHELKAAVERNLEVDLSFLNGYEQHREAIEAHRAELKIKAEHDKLQCLVTAAQRFGCPDNLALARYILTLEETIRDLESRIERLE